MEANAQESEREKLVRAVFENCDVDGDGLLNSPEMRKFARYTGFEGNDETWAAEYNLICSKFSQAAAGLDLPHFRQLVGEHSNEGYHFTDDDLCHLLASGQLALSPVTSSVATGRQGFELEAKRKEGEFALKAREMANKAKLRAELQAKQQAAEDSVKEQTAMKERKQESLVAEKDVSEEMQAAAHRRTAALAQESEQEKLSRTSFESWDKGEAEVQATSEIAEDYVKAQLAMQEAIDNMSQTCDELSAVSKVALTQRFEAESRPAKEVAKREVEKAQREVEEARREVEEARREAAERRFAEEQAEHAILKDELKTSKFTKEERQVELEAKKKVTQEAVATQQELGHPGAVAMSAVGAEALWESLLATRPDWSLKELAAAVAKLAKVGIETKEDLEKALAEGLNKKLQLAGQKTFNADTVRAMRACLGVKLRGRLHKKRMGSGAISIASAAEVTGSQGVTYGGLARAPTGICEEKSEQDNCIPQDDDQSDGFLIPP